MSNTATPATAHKPVAADQIDYVDLYTRWEHNNWSAMDIDFTQDRVDWQEKFDDFERMAARWNYSLFFYGEDAVADNLSPYIDAAPLEEQKYFITTQQVDESRHAVFFDRFFREVIGVEAKSVAESLQSTLPQLTWGFRKVFEKLDTVAGELRRDRSAPMLARAVTLYHLIVEATLAQTGQHFITDYTERMDILPGFRAGMVNVEMDEQRHIAFGVKILCDLNRQDPEVRPAVRELLAEVLPYTLGVFRPPGDDERYVTTFGKTLPEIFVMAEKQLESRLQAAGFELFGPDGVMPFLDPDVPHEERARRGLTMLQAGFMSQGTEPLNPTEEAMTYYFEAMTTAVRKDHGLAQPTTLQWVFNDAKPWHIVINNGSTEAREGLAGAPDVTFRTSLRDWIAITGGRLNPLRAIVTGRLRPRGDLRTIAQLPRVFER
jgi:putative sterol carrier protein